MTIPENVDANAKVVDLPNETSFWRNPLTWIVLAPLVALPLILLLRPSGGPKLPVIRDAPAFTLETQRSQSFSSDSLRGKAWIANFIFTRCEVACPISTSKMADVQRRLGSSAVQLLSFSVDPAHDTPERLTAYAKRFNADPGNWTFLRGKRRTMKHLVNNGFKIGMGIIGIKDDSDTDTTNIKQSDMVHGEHFVLVDKQLRIRGYYRLDSDADINKLVSDAQALAKSSK